MYETLESMSLARIMMMEVLLASSWISWFGHHLWQ